MAFTLNRLFSKNEPGEVKTLRDLNAKNATSLLLADGFAKQADAARNGRHESVVNFTMNPCVETGAAFVAADAAYKTADSWDEVARLARETIESKILENTRGPLVAAITATLDKLSAQMADTAAAESAAGAKLGVEVGTVESPVYQALHKKHEHLKRYLHMFTDGSCTAYGSFAELQTAAQFIINDR